MFQRFNEMKERREGGFTLIELLVVILIIAILAAIAIPVFLRQREKGYVAGVQSALKNGATAAESYATGVQGDYTNLTVDAMTQEGLKVQGGITMAVVSKDKDEFCISATHASLPAGHAWKTGYYYNGWGEPKNTTCPTLTAP